MRPAAIAILAAAALAGCGGGDDETSGSTTTTAATPATTSTSTTTDRRDRTSTSDEPGPSAVNLDAGHAITLVFVKGDCRRAVTASFISTAYGSLQNCLAASRPSALAKSVKIASLDPGAGTATVVPNGGTYDGVKVHVALVNEDGDWKVDALKANIPAGP